VIGGAAKGVVRDRLKELLEIGGSLHAVRCPIRQTTPVPSIEARSRFRITDSEFCWRGHRVHKAWCF
jgi:hypothetical protein